MFRSQLDAAAWAASARPVREPLGAVSVRAMLDATRTTSLPGAPDGEYEIVQFRTEFARKSNAVETAVMVKEGGEWKVAGYFIR